MRFPRRVRLLRHADFERVYKEGKRHFAAHMTVFYLPQNRKSGLRVGFTVGRVLGGAVERNRIRRRMREAVRLLLPAVSASADVVINPKKSALRGKLTELQREVEVAIAALQARGEEKPGRRDRR